MTSDEVLTETAEKTRHRTFAFVDLAGFTALTEAHGDVEAAGLVARFVALTRSLLEPDDQLVKSIGDAVMLAFRGPDAALSAVKGLVERCQEESGFPSPRAGLHHGTAVEVGSDWIGRSVNVAARVADQARGGQVLATSVVADAARTRGLPATALGCFEFRNVVDRVELWEIEVADPGFCWFTDPVCRMRIVRDVAAGRLRFAGADWWFCSLDCATTFVGDPERYAVDR